MRQALRRKTVMRSGSISALFIIIAIMVMVLIPSAVRAGGSVLTGTETRITTDPGDQYDPAIDGNLVVFTDYRNSDTDVYYTDLTTMAEHRVIVAPGNQELTGVSDGIIVYTDYRTADVMVFNTADGTTQNITAADKESVGRCFSSVDPAISLGLVAWADSRDGNMEIYAKYLPTGEERRITNSVDVDMKPTVSGSIIVWQRSVAGGTCDIWGYDWATGATTQITNTPAINERNPNIDGRKIVYQSDAGGAATGSDVYIYDLDSGTTKGLVIAGDQANPHVSGEFVSMDDLSAGLYHIKLWHYPSDEVFQITSGTSGQYLNDIDGNRIVWTDDRNGDLEIYMYEFQLSPSNTPPTVELGDNATINEGSTFTKTGSFTDPDADIWSATVDYGDGSGVQPLALNLDKTFNLSHTYVDNNSYTVTVTVTDSQGVAGSDTLTVTVNNVAPTAQIVSVTKPNPLLPKVHTVNFQGSFSDPGINDAPTATWDFGDGSTASGTSVQHVYSAPGTYTVTLTVTDKDGGIGTATTVVKVVTAGEYIDATKAYIQNLPDSAFKNLPGLRRAALLMELSVVSSLVDHQQYNAAILTLKFVVRPEMDGSLTPNDPRDDRDDWITNAGAQQDLCGMIDDVIAYLRTQM